MRKPLVFFVTKMTSERLNYHPPLKYQPRSFRAPDTAPIDLTPEQKKVLIYLVYKRGLRKSDLAMYAQWNISFDTEGDITWPQEDGDYQLIEDAVMLLVSTQSDSDVIFRDVVDLFKEGIQTSGSNMQTSLREGISNSQGIPTSEHLIRVMKTGQTEFLYSYVLQVFLGSKDQKTVGEVARSFQFAARSSWVLHDISKAFIVQKEVEGYKVKDDFTQGHAMLSAKWVEQYISKHCSLLAAKSEEGRKEKPLFSDKLVKSIAFAINFHHIFELLDKKIFTLEQAVEVLKKHGPVNLKNYLLLSMLAIIDVSSVKGYEHYLSQSTEPIKGKGNITQIISLAHTVFKDQAGIIFEPLLALLNSLLTYVNSESIIAGGHYDTERLSASLLDGQQLLADAIANTPVKAKDGGKEARVKMLISILD